MKLPFQVPVAHDGRTVYDSTSELIFQADGATAEELDLTVLAINALPDFVAFLHACEHANALDDDSRDGPDTIRMKALGRPLLARFPLPEPTPAEAHTFTVLVRCTDEDSTHYRDDAPYIQTVQAPDAASAGRQAQEALAEGNADWPDPADYEDQNDLFDAQQEVLDEYKVLAVFKGQARNLWRS